MTLINQKSLVGVRSTTLQRLPTSPLSSSSVGRCHPRTLFCSALHSAFRMSRSLETSALKRKRQEPDATRFLTDLDRAVLNVIKRKEDLGIFKGDIRMETKLIERDVNKALKTLLDHNLIKEVKNYKNKSRKHYMATEFEPSSEVSGGTWYAEGKLDTDLIQVLKSVSLTLVTKKKVATLEDIYEMLKRTKVVKIDLTKQQVAEILNSMVLSNEIIEVKSTGFGEYHLLPVGTICYRVGTAAGLDKAPKVGAMASIPCGACPRISKCTPDGVISPSTCVYYTKWLDISF